MDTLTNTEVQRAQDGWEAFTRYSIAATVFVVTIVGLMAFFLT